MASMRGVSEVGKEESFQSHGCDGAFVRRYARKGWVACEGVGVGAEGVCVEGGGGANL